MYISPQGVILHTYYHVDDESPFICSQMGDNGMRHCNSIPRLYEEGLQCQLDMGAFNSTDNTTCVDWNQYYTNCSAGDDNPFKGAINFDNIGYAWIAIFQVSFQNKFCTVVNTIAKNYKKNFKLNWTWVELGRTHTVSIIKQGCIQKHGVCPLAHWHKNVLAVLYWHFILLWKSYQS